MTAAPTRNTLSALSLALLLPTGIALATPEDDALIAAGKVVYEETAGDVGCAMCHGMNAAGDPELGAPYIRGASAAQVDSALHGAVPMMDFLELSPADQVAVLAYLQSLGRSDAMEHDPQVLLGKIVFEETAGGVGCMSCHGEDGSGDFGPDIRGKLSTDILQQLRSNPAMEIISLNDEELAAVAAYLDYLHLVSQQ